MKVGLIIMVITMCYAAYPDERVEGQCRADSPNCKQEIEFVWGYAQGTSDRLGKLMTDVKHMQEREECMRACLTPLKPKE